MILGFKLLVMVRLVDEALLSDLLTLVNDNGCALVALSVALSIRGLETREWRFAQCPYFRWRWFR